MFHEKEKLSLEIVDPYAADIDIRIYWEIIISHNINAIQSI